MNKEIEIGDLVVVTRPGCTRDIYMNWAIQNLDMNKWEENKLPSHSIIAKVIKKAPMLEKHNQKTILYGIEHDGCQYIIGKDGIKLDIRESMPQVALPALHSFSDFNPGPMFITFRCHSAVLEFANGDIINIPAPVAKENKTIEEKRHTDFSDSFVTVTGVHQDYLNLSNEGCLMFKTKEQKMLFYEYKGRIQNDKPRVLSCTSWTVRIRSAADTKECYVVRYPLMNKYLS